MNNTPEILKPREWPSKFRAYKMNLVNLKNFENGNEFISFFSFFLSLLDDITHILIHPSNGIFNRSKLNSKLITTF